MGTSTHQQHILLWTFAGFRGCSMLLSLLCSAPAHGRGKDRQHVGQGEQLLLFPAPLPLATQTH